MMISGALKMEFPALAVVAAVITLQPTFHETLDMSRRRLLGTIIGSLLAAGYIVWAPLAPTTINLSAVVFVGVLVILTLSNTFSLTTSSLLGVISYVSIVTMQEPTPMAALDRIAATCIGAGTSVLINFIFPVPPIENKFAMVSNKILMLDLRLLVLNLKEILGMEVDDQAFGKMNSEVIQAFNEAYNVRTLMMREQRFSVHSGAHSDYNWRHTTLWNIHNAVLSIHQDRGLFDPEAIVLSEEQRVQLENLVLYLGAIIDDDNGIPKGCKKRIDNIIEKIEEILAEEFTVESYEYFSTGGGFFATLLTNLKRFSDNIIVFEARHIPKAGGTTRKA